MNEKAEQLVNAITVPPSLSERQVQIAKRFAQSKMMDGHTIGSFCSDNGMSTKTFYLWMDDVHFKHYLNQISDAVVPTSEKDAYAKIKQKILLIAEKQNPSIKEIELFTDTFAYVVEADKNERMAALGLSDANTSATPFKTVEERKAALLSRLRS